MGMGDNQMRDGPMDGMSGRMGGAMHGQDDNSGRCDKASQGMRGASPIMLLIDDLTVEDLGNMTVNQIKDLSEKKMQELDNMTLNRSQAASGEEGAGERQHDPEPTEGRE